MGNFSPVTTMRFKKQNQNGVLFATIIALLILITLQIKLIHIPLKGNAYKAKLCHFGCPVAKAKLICGKFSSWLPRSWL